MKTYYKITLVESFTGIKTVQVESETPCTITISGDRKNKISTYNCYYSDLETAKKELLNHFKIKMEQAERNIRENEIFLKQLEKYMREVENYQT